MANNGNYRGYHWSNDAQQIHQELPLQSSPHPAFEDAAQMAQFAYAAYLRAQENRRTGTPQSDANAEGPPQSKINPALAQNYRDPPHGMHQGYQYDQQWQYGQSRPHQQQQQPQQHSYQPYYQSRFQPQQTAEHQQRERLEEQQREHMRKKERQRLQREHLKQQKHQEREIEKEKKREESIQRRQEIQQRQQEEKKKRQEEQERQREQKRQQKEEQRRQQAEVKIRQEEQQQQQYKQQLSEEQQRQQIIRNAQRQQYARSFNSSSPALGHSDPQSHNSQPAQSHTTSSMTPPQQFSPPPSIQDPPPRMSHSPLQPQAHISSQVPMKRPAATAFADSRSYEHSTPPIRSETPAENSSIVTSRQNMSHHDPPRSATPQNAIPLAQSRKPISTPSEPASLSTPSISNSRHPSEPYTSASRSTLGPRPPLGPGSSTKSGPANQMMFQTRKSDGPLPKPNLPWRGTSNTLDRTIPVPDSTKRASLPWIPPNRTQTPISNPPSHSLTGTPKTNSPSLPSVSTSTQSPPICQTYRPPSTSSAITQAPQVATSGPGPTQPPQTKQHHHPDRTSHPKKPDSISATATAPPPLPAHLPANAPQSNGFQHQPMPSRVVPRPPSYVWKPGQAAAAGPRFNSPLPGNHYAGQVPPSKMRRLNDGGKQNATVRDSGGPKFRPGDYLRDPPSQSHLTLRKDMIQPMNTLEALKKENYDPATIAHDVLINCAKHPTERPLNDHWEPIRKKFPEVDFSKDLSTFRWDLVEESQARMASLSKPNAKPQAAPTTAPAAAPLPGRVLGHPAPMAPVTAPTRAPAASNGPPATGQSQPTLAGLPWIDLGAPRSPVNTNQHQQTHNSLRELPFQAPTYYSRPVGASPSKHSNLPIGLPAPTPAPAPAPHYEPLAFSQSPSVQLPPPPKPTSSKQPELTPKHAPKSTPKSTPKAKSTPKSKSNSKSKSSVRATPTEPDTPRSHSSKEHSQPLVVVPPSPAKMSFGKRRPGRPKKSTEVVVEIPGSKVQYPVFRCRWESCQAELHNLKALESHLMQGHILNSITCNWKDCSDTTPKAASDMWTHAQEVHLAPLAWQFGDGPKVPVTGEKNDMPAFDILLPASRL